MQEEVINDTNDVDETKFKSYGREVHVTSSTCTSGTRTEMEINDVNRRRVLEWSFDDGNDNHDDDDDDESSNAVDTSSTREEYPSQHEIEGIHSYFLAPLSPRSSSRRRRRKTRRRGQKTISLSSFCSSSQVDSSDSAADGNCKSHHDVSSSLKDIAMRHKNITNNKSAAGIQQNQSILGHRHLRTTTCSWKESPHEEQQRTNKHYSSDEVFDMLSQMNIPDLSSIVTSSSTSTSTTRSSTSYSSSYSISHHQSENRHHEDQYAFPVRQSAMANENHWTCSASWDSWWSILHSIGMSNDEKAQNNCTNDTKNWAMSGAWSSYDSWMEYFNMEKSHDGNEGNARANKSNNDLCTANYEKKKPKSILLPRRMGFP